MDWRHLFFGFDGRISRAPYWVATAVLLVGEFLLVWIAQDNARLGTVLGLAMLYPEAAVLFKRGHDRGTPDAVIVAYLALSAALGGLTILGLDGSPERASGLYWLVAIPAMALALYLLVELGFRRGVRGPNQHGPDPLQEPRD